MLEYTIHPLSSELPPSLTKALLAATTAKNTLPSLDLAHFNSQRQIWIDAFDALVLTNETFWCNNSDFQCCIYPDFVITSTVSKGVQKEWMKHGKTYEILDLFKRD